MREVGDLTSSRADMLLNVKTRLEHARANVSDLEAAIAWYTEVLGFEVDALWPPDRPNYAHFRHAAGEVFAIQEAEGRGARFNFTWMIPSHCGMTSRTVRRSWMRSSTRRTGPESSPSLIRMATNLVSSIA